MYIIGIKYKKCKIGNMYFMYIDDLKKIIKKNKLIK